MAILNIKQVASAAFFIAPNTYQDHKSESSMHYPHLASIAAGFFKAHYHQEPDPTNSLLNICGYGD
ncbi:hypothetical protein [Citrobacter freundii]|uniref:hypothetical protein n=1 Tax=Citrobacter freundii TaxID=546 RepID=UPI001D0FE254|nr:hypothetical protein [Citrobacter freundii]MCC2939168.1 hypothetical protein [Citrobacter freundii]MDH0767889.1 hypothetical protein [Citrobacter freundii]MDH1808035.1 hypothetical protein [Citrobacter freundii]MDH1965072.1 hypothetical protein [Citrobacter freundii]